MLRTILVPLDGSPLAERALPYAESLAEATAAQLVLLRATPFDIIEPPQDDLDLADEARGYLAQIAARLSARGHQVTTVARWGHTAGCIVRQAQASNADLIVMSTHSRSGLGRWMYGSVADQVLRAAAAPVVLVPPMATGRWDSGHLNRILVPLDGSDLAEAVIEPVAQLASRLGSEIILLEVVPFPAYAPYDNGAAMAAFDPDKELADSETYLRGVATRLARAGIQLRTRAELAQPALAIAEIARSENADLIAMATHGRSGFARLVVGSVATGTLQRTRVPLLLIGPAVVKASTAEAASEPSALTAVG